MKFDVNAFTKCLAEKILYIAVFFFVFFGLMFSAAMSMAQELQKPTGRIKLPLFLSFTIHLSSFILMCSLAGFFVMYLDINPFLMCFIAGVMGIGSLFISKWIFNMFDESAGFDSFAGKVRAFAKAFWGAMDAVKNNKTNDTTSD